MKFCVESDFQVSNDKIHHLELKIKMMYDLELFEKSFYFLASPFQGLNRALLAILDTFKGLIGSCKPDGRFSDVLHFKMAYIALYQVI